MIWDILENVMKGHPVLLNRAPTLHRLGIQAFQPRMIEGKAIQLHPLACTAFNADFDGDQMAVHLPLGNAAVMEAQLLMLGSQNILNPANGAPITVPSQDMVLGLYYITKIRPGAKGEGMKFYSAEEVIVAYNEKAIDMHAKISVRLPADKQDPSKGTQMVETTAGRIIVNQYVPDEVSYVNEVLGKKSLRKIITDVIKHTGVTRTAKFLDDIKNLGYDQAFRAGISFNLGDVLVPAEKTSLVEDAYKQVANIRDDYDNGFITNNERYNKVIDLWSAVDNKLTKIVTNQISADQQGFNPVYMMLDSGARGSTTQIKQLCGMRGLMAKPQKAGASGADIIENPIVSNLKEGMTVLEYFISTHGARKGLADTALKTADAGYLTRRLVDVSHDVIINEQDCGTLRGLIATAIKNKDEVVESLGERILGRTSVHLQPSHRRTHHQGRRGDPREGGRPYRLPPYRAGGDPLSADLRKPQGCLRQVLRTQPRHQPHGRERRSGRCHRGTVHRRAWYPVDSAYIPRRRYSLIFSRRLFHRVQVRWCPQVRGTPYH